MKLRLGQPVHALDGAYGEVDDIVVDPHARTVTHLVVQPHRNHHQARLIPIRLVTVDGDTVNIALDTAHIRDLKAVSGSDYVKIGEPIDIDGDWDVGIEDIVVTSMMSNDMLPYSYGYIPYDDHVAVNFDRIPRGDCEIRRSSQVTSSDDHDIGTVEGFLVDDDDLAGVVVRSGRHGLRHYVALPMNSVEKVRNDVIELNIDRDSFRNLPIADNIFGADDPPSSLTRIEHRAGVLAQSLKAKIAARVGH